MRIPQREGGQLRGTPRLKETAAGGPRSAPVSTSGLSNRPGASHREEQSPFSVDDSFSQACEAENNKVMGLAPLASNRIRIAPKDEKGKFEGHEKTLSPMVDLADKTSLQRPQGGEESMAFLILTDAEGRMLPTWPI